MSSKFFIGALPVDLITGLILKQGQNGDAAKIAARAAEGIVVINATEQLLSGDAAGFVNTLAAALTSGKALDPAETLAVQNAMILAQPLGVLVKIKAGTLLATAESAVVTEVLEEARAVCNGFVAAVPAAPAA